jgi:O-acetyl-ADP-ribose deacetylase (regulator of RNase III)
MKKLILNICATAESLGLKSIAIPAISSGLFGYPIDYCTTDIFTALEQYALERAA